VSASEPGSPAAQPIATTDAARALVDRLARAERLAIDTEGDGMFRYRTRLCTLQLSDAGEIAVVDTLALPVAPLFGALLGAAGPEKIVHDASFDASVLFAQGVALGRVFDTAVAARFLGFASTGLSSLLRQLFDYNLPKHQQQADWGKRPLAAEAMRYLEDDVRYLHQLADALLEEVRARDIEPEVREECAYVLGEAQRAQPEEPPWLRIKGGILRPPAERARLVELAELREQLARADDVPPGRFLPGELLSRLARDPVPEGPELVRLLGSKAVHAALFADALARAAQRSDAPAEQLARFAEVPSPAELARRKRRKAWLSEFREQEAKARGVDLQVVLPGHCLNDIAELSELSAQSLQQVPGFGAVRFERYGARLLQRAASVRE
jgi:ribonuclease D